MARIFIISNRVAIPRAASQPGGLEVVLKATLRKHPCVWMGWSGEVNEKPRTQTIVDGSNSYIVTDLKPEDFDDVDRVPETAAAIARKFGPEMVRTLESLGWKFTIGVEEPVA